MKKDNKKMQKIVYILNYFTAICFYIASIINFTSRNTSIGTTNLCLGSTFLCLGSVNYNQYKKLEKENNDKK